MEEHRESRSLWLPVSCTILVMIMAAYVAGYFALCKSVVQPTEPDYPHEFIRIYDVRWVARM